MHKIILALLLWSMVFLAAMESRGQDRPSSVQARDLIYRARVVWMEGYPGDTVLAGPRSLLIDPVTNRPAKGMRLTRDRSVVVPVVHEGEGKKCSLYFLAFKAESCATKRATQIGADPFALVIPDDFSKVEDLQKVQRKQTLPDGTVRYHESDGLIAYTAQDSAWESDIAGAAGTSEVLNNRLPISDGGITPTIYGVTVATKNMGGPEEPRPVTANVTRLAGPPEAGVFPPSFMVKTSAQPPAEVTHPITQVSGEGPLFLTNIIPHQLKPTVGGVQMKESTGDASLSAPEVVQIGDGEGVIQVVTSEVPSDLYLSTSQGKITLTPEEVTSIPGGKAVVNYVPASVPPGKDGKKRDPAAIAGVVSGIIGTGSVIVAQLTPGKQTKDEKEPEAPVYVALVSHASSSNGGDSSRPSLEKAVEEATSTLEVYMDNGAPGIATTWDGEIVCDNPECQKDPNNRCVVRKTGESRWKTGPEGHFPRPPLGGSRIECDPEKGGCGGCWMNPEGGARKLWEKGHPPKHPAVGTTPRTQEKSPTPPPGNPGTRGREPEPPKGVDKVVESKPTPTAPPGKCKFIVPPFEYPPEIDFKEDEITFLKPVGFRGMWDKAAGTVLWTGRRFGKTRGFPSEATSKIDLDEVCDAPQWNADVDILLYVELSTDLKLVVNTGTVANAEVHLDVEARGAVEVRDSYSSHSEPKDLGTLETEHRGGLSFSFKPVGVGIDAKVENTIKPRIKRMEGTGDSKGKGYLWLSTPSPRGKGDCFRQTVKLKGLIDLQLNPSFAGAITGEASLIVEPLNWIHIVQCFNCGATAAITAGESLDPSLKDGKKLGQLLEDSWRARKDGKGEPTGLPPVVRRIAQTLRHEGLKGKEKQ